MSRRPPGISINARPPYAPDLVSLYVGHGWMHALATALNELDLYGEADPTLILPPGHDPAAYTWPIRGRRVEIVGYLDAPCLRRLMAALMRDGAHCVAGLDTAGKLHTVSDRIARRAA
ncbi:MAG: hypothetical protein H0V62_03860 [Gammaproteobacteria bacterium]|nr:hypothetical protein [Gammaproteobacteria bacterium]